MGRLSVLKLVTICTCQTINKRKSRQACSASIAIWALTQSASSLAIKEPVWRRTKKRLEKKLRKSGFRIISGSWDFDKLNRSRYETSRLPEPEPEHEHAKRRSRYSIPQDSPEPERRTSTVQVSNLDDDADDYRPASPQFECNLCKDRFYLLKIEIFEELLK